MLASRFVAERSHQDHRRSPVGLSQSSEDLQAGADRHSDVGNDNVERLASLAGLQARGDVHEQAPAVDDLEDFVAIAPQRFPNDSAHLFVVLGEQDTRRR